MSFVIQLVQGRSLKLTQVKSEILRIGRGTNADIRSENPAVAFEHALVEKDEGGYTIVDKGSITGTYVNRKPVESQRLAKGDVIEVGDLHIEVQVAEASKPLFLKLVMARRPQTTGAEQFDGDDTGTRSQAEAGSGVVAAKKIDYVDAYALRRPYLTKMTVASLLLIGALGVVGEVMQPDKQAVFMPGGVSGAHSRAKDAAGKNIAEQCSACHTPWKSITDNKCAACHQMAAHSTQEKESPACYSCHSEHRGLARLAAIPDARCNECHRDLSDHVKSGEAELAKLRFASGRYSFAEIQKINGFGGAHPDFKFPKDPNNVKFNHKLHLAPNGVQNAQGRREVLNCNYCHVLVEKNGKFDPAPLAFENHCQQCHKLTFDPRYPRAEAPHGGDPGLVYGYILSVYAGGGADAVTDLSDRRRILRFRTDASADSRGLLAAEQVIKTKCQKCHDVVRRDNRLVVDPPQILVDWFAKAEYTHTSHRNIACEKCHAGARTSVPTSDVLMPRLADCTDCHGAKASAAGVKQTASSCVACHDYHQRTKSLKPAVIVAGVTGGAAGALLDPLAGGRMLQTILIAAIVVLLFVVFIPLGAALYQRLKPSRSAAARAAAAPPPPPKAAPMAAPPNMAPSAPAEPPMRASAPQRAEAAPTQMINLEELKKPAAPQVSPTGTEMMQWYGMLRCTAGPLEGQNFIIEEGGFYIGRDSTMSKVVINDGRVSKRHVRVQTKNGKVYVIDEGSTNGTFLSAGGERITEHQLKRGESIILADNAATFVYQI